MIFATPLPPSTGSAEIDIATNVLSWLFGGGGLALLLGWLHKRRKHPLDRASTMSNMSVQQATMAMAMMTAAQETADRAEAKADKAQEKANRAEDKAQGLAGKVEVLEVALSAFRNWADHIFANWSEVRQHQDPPPLPPEVHK